MNAYSPGPTAPRYQLAAARHTFTRRPGRSLTLSLVAALLWLATLAPALTPATLAAEILPTVWYFAEGYTGTGFDEYLTIQNPNPTPAEVRVTYFKADGTTKIHERSVAGQSRSTVTVYDPIEGIGRIEGAAGGVSAKVESTNAVGIVVERPMYFTYNGASITNITGGHNVMGANAPQPTWYFAEGYTGTGFEEYLTIMNPNAAPALVTITYFRTGQAPITRQVTVLPTSRYTVEVHKTTDGVGPNEAVSAKVETDAATPIVVERPMYFSYSSPVVSSATGGHNVIGANSPLPTWYFPFATTQSEFDSYLTLMNIFPTDAQVRVTAYGRDGSAPTTATLDVPANSRSTYNLRTSPAFGNNKSGGLKVETLNGINLVVERPMYFRYRVDPVRANGGTNTLGAAGTGPVWLFAEGFTGTGFDQFIEILNPNPTPATVRITYYLPSGPPKTKTETVPPNSEKFIYANDSAQAGRGNAISARVETTNGTNIVVERLMFFIYNGRIDGGHGIIGFSPTITASGVGGR